MKTGLGNQGEAGCHSHYILEEIINHTKSKWIKILF
jgi:hypothetical protein